MKQTIHLFCLIFILHFSQFYLNAQNVLQTMIDTSIEGSTINVPSGNYLESISITKSLNLECSNGGCIIDVRGLQSGVEIEAVNVSISGFEIIGDTSTIYGLLIKPFSNNIVIDNNIIHGMKRPNPNNTSPLSYGILSYGTSSLDQPTNLTFSNNTIYDISGSAISLGSYSDSVLVSSNIFYMIDTVIYEGLPLNVGVQSEFGNNIEISNNSFDSFIIASSLINCNYSIIENNLYSNTDILLNTTYPHSNILNDSPWWAVLYDVPITSNTYQFYYSNFYLVPSGLLTTLTSSEITYIPDDNFENALIELQLDDYMNDSVNTSSIATLMYLDISNLSIENLIGIEDFLSLEELYCGYNNLTNIDLTNNSNLVKVHCQKNNINSLLFDSNFLLEELYCYDNNLTTLDLSSFSSLIDLKCYTNSLTNLELSNHISLTNLSCGYNNITQLNLTNNTNLLQLYCHDNLLWNLDIRNGNNFNMDINTKSNFDLSCISVDNEIFSENTWGNIYGNVDTWTIFSNNCNLLSIQEHTTNKKLIKKVNIFGQNTEKSNGILFYIYDDGSVEKRMELIF